MELSGVSDFLAYTPTLQDDESIKSLFLRASSFNGFISPTQMLRWTTGKQLTTVVNSEKQFIHACEALGIKFTSASAKLSPTLYGLSECNFLGIRIRRDRLTKNFKYCPDCLSEYGYHKRTWEHEYFNVCVEHNLRLIDSCPACEKALDWEREKFFECSCGEQKLVDVSATQCEPSVERFLEKVFFESNQKAYLDFEEMLQSLSRFFGGSRMPRELQELAVMGMESPEKLSDILTSELLNDSHTLKYHPILTMVDFEMASGAQIKQLVKLTKESFYRSAQTDSYVDYSGELLEYGRVSKILGISTSQAAELRRNNILKGYQVKPGAPFKIEQRSIHNLVTRLGMVPSYTLKQSVTVDDCLNNPDIKLTLSEILKGVFNETIKLVSFSWSAPLLSMRIEKQFPKFSKQKLFQLVPLKDYVEYTGLHTNDVRVAIKEYSEIDYFNSGYTNGANKYLTIEIANQLTEILKHRYSKPSKIERVRAAVQSKALPETSVAVYFK